MFFKILQGSCFFSPFTGFNLHLFNGQEKDDEVNSTTGGDYDFGARIYDARICRFLSIDPLAEKFPNESPYVFAGNNPIALIDIDGNSKGDPEVQVSGKKVIVKFTYLDVDYELSFKTNKPQKYKITNLKTGEKGKFNFYSDARIIGGNPKSLALFKLQQTDVSKLGGQVDRRKLLDAKVGTVKVLDLIKSALDQNPTFKVAIIGNVAVSPADLNNNNDYTSGYNFIGHDQQDFNGFVKERAENAKKEYFGDKTNVETYGINDVPEDDKKYLDLSKPNEDKTGATIYLKGTKSAPIEDKKNVPLL